MNVQVIEQPLAAVLEIPGGGAAVRITEVLPETSAASAGLRVGDCVLAVDGERLEVQREEDAGALAALLRSYQPGATIQLRLWREGREMNMPLDLEAQPVSASEAEQLELPEAECTVREATDEDRRAAGLAAPALVVAHVAPAGWSDLAGLRAGDVIVSLAGAPVKTLAELAAEQVRLNQSPPTEPVEVVVRRDALRTLFFELEWSPSS